MKRAPGEDARHTTEKRSKAGVHDSSGGVLKFGKGGIILGAEKVRLTQAGGNTRGTDAVGWCGAGGKEDSVLLVKEPLSRASPPLHGRTGAREKVEKI